MRTGQRLSAASLERHTGVEGKGGPLGLRFFRLLLSLPSTRLRGTIFNGTISGSGWEATNVVALFQKPDSYSRRSSLPRKRKGC